MNAQLDPLINNAKTWKIYSIKKLKVPSHCACGTKPIAEAVILEKLATKELLRISNCCFKYFPGIRPASIIEDVRKLSKDISGVMSPESLHYALDKGLIREGERNFYLGILKKNNLPLAIKNRQREINRKFLAEALTN